MRIEEDDVVDYLSECTSEEIVEILDLSLPSLLKHSDVAEMLLDLVPEHYLCRYKRLHN